MRRRPDLVLVILWACFVGRGLFYATLLPLWEGYDEYSHFAYVQHFVLQGSIPVPGSSRISREVAASLRSAPLPWTLRDQFPGAISHDQFWKLPPPERATRIAPLLASPGPAAREEDPAAQLIYEAQHPPLYYWILSPFLRLANGLSLPARVFVLRCVSILIASAALPFGFAIARRVFRDSRIAAGVVAVATCMPEAFINFARIGNESLSLFFYTFLAWTLLRLLDRGPSYANTAMIGIALAGGLLTKVYFLTAIPVVCVVYLLAWRRTRARLALITAHAATALALAALASFWWYRFIYLSTGDYTGHLQSAGIRMVPWADRIHTALHLNWLRALDIAMLSHIWFGAWSFLQVRSWIYHLFYFVGVVAFLGLLRIAFRASGFERHPLLVLALLELCFAASIAYHVTLSQIIYGAPLTSGWYFYCLLFAETTLLCAGLMALLPSRGRAWALPTLAALFAALDLYGVHFVLLPYYTGLVAHTPAGGLPIFRLTQLAATGFGEVSTRLMLNRPYLFGPAAFWMLWGIYWMATIACVVIAIRGACTGLPRPVN